VLELDDSIDDEKRAVVAEGDALAELVEGREGGVDGVWSLELALTVVGIELDSAGVLGFGYAIAEEHEPGL